MTSLLNMYKENYEWLVGRHLCYTLMYKLISLIALDLKKTLK